jgi:hypothetical protein
MGNNPLSSKMKNFIVFCIYGLLVYTYLGKTERNEIVSSCLNLTDFSKVSSVVNRTLSFALFSLLHDNTFDVTLSSNSLSSDRTKFSKCF